MCDNNNKNKQSLLEISAIESSFVFAAFSQR